MNIVTTDIPEELFFLPEYVPVVKTKKENNNVPDIDSLTPQQLEVYNVLISYLQGLLDSGVRMIVLKGYAGTGKTYVITQVLKWYVMMMQNNIAITAPTNKAVKVLRQTANFEHSLISYSTIHKLYGLKEKIDEQTGKITFEKEFGAPSSVDDKDGLILDETSMLPDELFDLIEAENRRSKPVEDNRAVTHKGNTDDFLDAIVNKNRTYDSNLKVIFLGDPIQIPPVGKTDCIPFNENNAEEYGIKTLSLTEIIRQKEGNPILDIATIIRENYKSSYLPYNRQTVHNSIGGVMFINSLDKDILYRLCETYFSSQHFENDSDFMKVIAWTNKTVDFMNDKIRSFIYKEALQQAVDKRISEMGHNLQKQDILMAHKTAKLPRILIGEKLIANSPIIQDLGFKQVIQFNTNDEFEVLAYDIQERKVFENYTVNIYETKVSYTNYGTNRKETKILEILHEDSLTTYDKILDTLKKKAISDKGPTKGQSWKLFYTMKQKFADVKYNYAITAHKAQGSTYDNAIVIAADIMKNSRVEERNRILYVAVTRAKHNLFIVE